MCVCAHEQKREEGGWGKREQNRERERERGVEG